MGLTSEDVGLVVVVSSGAHAGQATQPLRVHEFRHQVLVLLKLTVERVTDRKARGLQMEEIGFKFQIFFFS